MMFLSHKTVNCRRGGSGLQRLVRQTVNHLDQSRLSETPRECDCQCPPLCHQTVAVAMRHTTRELAPALQSDKDVRPMCRETNRSFSGPPKNYCRYSHHRRESS